MNLLYLYTAAGGAWRSVFSWMFHMPCLFHLLTGWYCPGCGGTRAVKYLLQGNFMMSLQYHPLVLYTVAAVLVKAAAFAAAKALKRREYSPGHGKLLVYGALVVVIVNWCVKNYLLVVKGIDLLSTPL